MNCPICKKKLVLPTGFEEFPILLIGNAPDDNGITAGQPFYGQTTKILFAELGRYGIDLRSCRKTNYWMHRKDSKCKKFMEQQLTKEAKGKKAILLMGAEPVKFFTAGQYGVKELTSLRIEPETAFTALVIMASVNPSETHRGGIGELRLAIKRFSDALKEEGLP